MTPSLYAHLRLEGQVIGPDGECVRKIDLEGRAEENDKCMGIWIT